MGKGLSPILIIYLKQNNHIPGKKLMFKERKINMVTQWNKNLTNYPQVILNLVVN